MSFLLRLLMVGACTAMPGCQRTPAPMQTAPAVEPPASAAGPPAQSHGAAPIPSEGAVIAYRCDNGDRLDARYGHGKVLLRWPDGRSVALPRAESASKGAGDAYVGATVSLQRDGDRIALHDGDAAVQACIAASDGG